MTFDLSSLIHHYEVIYNELCLSSEISILNWMFINLDIQTHDDGMMIKAAQYSFCIDIQHYIWWETKISTNYTWLL